MALTLRLSNYMNEDVTAYFTLGTVAGGAKIGDFKWDHSVEHGAEGDLKGWWKIPAHIGMAWTLPENLTVNGNCAFGAYAQNCPPWSVWPTGINLAEFNINLPSGQDTVDISCVAGVNATIGYRLTGGGPWNAGSNHPHVTEISNKPLNQNVGQVGVYPYLCDVCTGSHHPPRCPDAPPKKGGCQKEAICNVQRVSPDYNGTVEIQFLGFIR